MADIRKEQERDELHRAIWSIADDLRGSVDGWDFKSYVLGTMFYRFISENLTTYINKGEWDAGYTDFDYAKNLVFSPHAVQKGIEALKAGCHIVTDTQMAKAGINKTALGKLGGQVHCFMADEDVAQEAKARGITRAAVCMERAAKLEKPCIFAIGNAPTALIALKGLMDGGKLDPALIIGVPVGFVNVVESKELILGTNVPHIVARGRKGGSNVAAAICNALLYQIGRWKLISQRTANGSGWATPPAPAPRRRPRQRSGCSFLKGRRSALRC